jgi:ribonuclease P protein component
MLPKAKRLTKGSDINKVYQAKKTLSSQNFRINFDFLAENGPVATVVASKRIGKANVRNRLKRQIREIFKTSKLSTEPTTLRLVITAREGAENLEFPAIQTEMLELLGRIRY